MTIYRIFLCGDMAVYQREREHETNVPKYLVLNVPTGRIVKESGRRETAEKWAIKHSDSPDGK